MTPTTSTPAPATASAKRTRRRTPGPPRRRRSVPDVELRLALPDVALDVGGDPAERRALGEVERLAGLARARRVPRRRIHGRLGAVRRVMDHRRLVDEHERRLDQT